jgi:hypothetical protein
MKLVMAPLVEFIKWVWPMYSSRLVGRMASDNGSVIFDLNFASGTSDSRFISSRYTYVAKVLVFLLYRFAIKAEDVDAFRM